jgi:hypothetical protein
VRKGYYNVHFAQGRSECQVRKVTFRKLSTKERNQSMSLDFQNPKLMYFFLHIATFFKQKKKETAFFLPPPKITNWIPESGM